MDEKNISANAENTDKPKRKKSAKSESSAAKVDTNPLKTEVSDDAKEISEKTHIDIDCIQAILDSDFKALLNKNVGAYLKILEREYNIDLSEFKRKFEAFKSEHSNGKNPQQLRQKSANLYVKDNKKGENLLLILLFLLVLIFAIFYFKLYRFMDIFLDKNDTISYSDAKVVEKVEDELVKIGVSVPQFDENKTLVGISDDNGSNLNALDKSILSQQSDINASARVMVIDENSTAQMGEIVTIIPNQLVWISINDLDTGKNASLATQEPFEINISKHQTVLTGHGNFSLQNGNKKLEFSGKDKVRFHTNEGNISEISYDEYVNLNKKIQN